MTKYVSGIRPSGQLHLGNYLGALKQWKFLQSTGADCYFFVADMHGQYTARDCASTYAALHNIGIKTYKQSIFSRELLQMQHELSFHATVGELNRQVQFKDKKDKGENPSAFFYTYPILMAADILYHEATHVPIGDDQKQHLELVRELARKIGRKVPEAVILPVGSRIMSLTTPSKKMSKSDLDVMGCIYLCDTSDQINTKVNGAVSTPEGVSNLLEIVNALGGHFEYTGHNASLKRYIVEVLIYELGAK